SHAVRLDATPPASWGRRFSLRGRFTQGLLKRAGDLSHWSGQAYAELPRADLSQLRRHVSLPFELSEGDGALRAWVEVSKGEASAATLDMALRAVKLRLSREAEALDLAGVEGRLALQTRGTQLSLAARQLGFEGADGLLWPRSDWNITLRRAPGAGLMVDLAQLQGGEFAAERLDLALLAQIAERLPLAAGQRELIRSLAPRGLVSGLQLGWDGPLNKPRSYRVKARVEGLALEAAAPGEQPGRPGLQGATLTLDATQLGGMADLAFADGALEFPGLFEEARVPLRQLNGKLSWQLASATKPLSLHFSRMQLANDDLSASFDAEWQAGAKLLTPGHLNLTGRIERARAERLARYFPLFMVDTRHYLQNALRGGELRAAQFKLQGELADFPFAASRNGVFQVSTQARDVELAYVTALDAKGGFVWPVMQHVNAEVLIDRGSLQIRNGRAQVLGYELSGVNGGFKDMLHAPVLALDGNGRGPTAEILRYLAASPVGGWLANGLEPTEISGSATLKLGLAIPLADSAHSSVKGQVLLAGNEIKLRPDLPLLADARARIDFDQRGFQLSDGAARVVGGDASFEGGTQADGSLRFVALGVASAEGLRRAPELGLPATLARQLNGQAPYRLGLSVNQGRSEINLTSTLQGIGAELPAPLAKEADAALPLRIQTTPLSGSGTPRDELRVELGKLLEARYVRQLGSGTVRVLRGALALQEKLPALPETGVLMQASVGAVDLDAWRAVVGKLTAGEGGSAEADSYLPVAISLRAQSLVFAGRPLDQVSANITRLSQANGSSTWRAALDARQLNGLLEYRLGTEGQPATVYARLKRLSIPKSEADSVTALLEQAPEDMPAFDIVADDFELRGRKFGQLEIDARYTPGTVREWNLQKLQIRNPHATLSASGRWGAEGPGARSRTTLDWQLAVADAGSLLDSLGYGQLLSKGHGQLKGRIGWAGSPLSPDYPSMNGQLRLDLEAGQFLKVDPGMGRLLGVLSLQALPRRLLFDFRDVFDAGFAFDQIGGDIAIAHGVASSQELNMKGVQASVNLKGRTDLAAETQDLHVVVVPEVNAGGASLAYAAVNPVVGLGTFVAQLLLRRPMMEAGTRQFHVTGTWDDPKVERIETPAAAASAAASAAVPAAAVSGAVK
ncbi:MAG TPA: YhdP family protein, partial [Burkholderiaceae bacterium]